MWRIVAGQQRGTSHIRNHLPCQDAYATCHLGEKVILLIADGAGSAPLAEVGAQTAVQAVLQFLEQRLHQVIELVTLQESVQIAQQALSTVANQRQVPLRDLACTLIVTVATPTQVLTVQIGDGAVVVGTTTGELYSLTGPQVEEYANETTFLSSPTALEQMQSNHWLHPPKYLAVFSDGLQRLALKFPGATPHPPFFRPLFDFLEGETDKTKAQQELALFLASPRLTSRTDDDLTLLLAALDS